MKYRVASAAALLLALTLPAYAQGTAPATSSTPATRTLPSAAQPPDGSAKTRLTDARFVSQAAIGGMAEIQLSKLAIQKSSNPKLKKFAEQMLEDHQATAIKLKQIAQKHQLAVPTALDAAHRQTIAELQGLDGEAFDRTYVNVTKQDHDTTVGLFDQAAGETALNRDLRDFAAQTLPVLRMHQQHAHQLTETDETRAPSITGRNEGGGGFAPVERDTKANRVK